MDGVEWGSRVQGMTAITQVRNHGRETGTRGLVLREMERHVLPPNHKDANALPQRCVAPGDRAQTLWWKVQQGSFCGRGDI